MKYACIYYLFPSDDTEMAIFNLTVAIMAQCVERHSQMA